MLFDLMIFSLSVVGRWRSSTIQLFAFQKNSSVGPCLPVIRAFIEILSKFNEQNIVWRQFPSEECSTINTCKERISLNSRSFYLNLDTLHLEIEEIVVFYWPHLRRRFSQCEIKFDDALNEFFSFRRRIDWKMFKKKQRFSDENSWRRKDEVRLAQILDVDEFWFEFEKYFCRKMRTEKRSDRLKFVGLKTIEFVSTDRFVQDATSRIEISSFDRKKTDFHRFERLFLLWVKSISFSLSSSIKQTIGSEKKNSERSFVLKSEKENLKKRKLKKLEASLNFSFRQQEKRKTNRAVTSNSFSLVCWEKKSIDLNFDVRTGEFRLEKRKRSHALANSHSIFFFLFLSFFVDEFLSLISIVSVRIRSRQSARVTKSIRNSF